MKKRIVSILLTLCMVLMLVPITAFAANGDAAELQALLDAGGTVTLTKDYSIDTTLRVNNTVTLDLNGHVIKMTGEGCGFIFNGKVTLMDSNPGATHTGENASLPAGGVITGGYVRITDYFTMNGGTIRPTNFEGVLVDENMCFIMNGGAIESSTANGDTQAFQLKKEGRIIANGGTVKGTVYFELDGFIMPATSIDGCTKFYDPVTGGHDYQIISYGVYYGGITGGRVEGTYHTVSFDLNGGSGSIPKQWFVNIDTAQALEPAAPTREGYEFAGWYNGDTKYDFTQNVTEDITLTAKWENPEAPVITGLEDGKTYCDTVQFEVSDNVGVASITANGVTLTPDANNKYTLEKGTGTVTVVAIDKANNQTSVTVTVNNGHTGGTATCTQKAKCDICGEEYGELANHSLSKTDAKDATCTEDGNIEYWTCSVCNKYFSDETGTNEIEKDSWVIKAAHKLTKTEASAAIVTATGNKEYWHCKDCGKYFADENGTKEIKLEDTIISKLSPEIIEGKGQSITAGEKKELTFKSNAAFSDFIRVELDGKTLDAKNYTVKEGSTVVTLKADYVATLSAGEHTIGIVSASGTATTTFTVNAKTVVDNDTKSPQTGDNSHMALWIALLAASVFGLAGTAVYSKRKRVR